jgi:nucleolar protein 56
MEIVAWFGRIDPDNGRLLSSGSREEMIMWLEEPLQDYPLEQPDLRSLAKVCGLLKSDQEYNALLREVAIGLARKQLEDFVTEEQDLLQAVEALDDLHEAINLLDERLYEWSRLRRDDVVHGRDLAQSLSHDPAAGELARALLSLRESRVHMEENVSQVAEKLAPSLSSLAGPLLAARLISRAGSLKRLSELPSSALQLMGAEKALFKHLRGRAPSPKHGLIYRHPAISGAPKRLRGRISRALAGKLAIAARMDYFGASPSPDLKESLDKRLAEIRRTRKRKS